MSSDEQRAFKKDLLNDSDLSAEFELHRLISNTLEQPDEMRFRRKLQDVIHKSERKRTEGSPFSAFKSRRIIYAIPVLILIPVLIFLILGSRSMTPDEIFDRYFTPYSQDVSSRAIHKGTGDSLSMAVYYYRENQYDISDRILNRVLKTDSTNLTARFYRGLSLMYLDHFSQAIPDFRSVIHDDFNFYQEHSNWYLGLCYLKTGQIREARDCFSELCYKNSVYSEKSAKILKNFHDYNSH